MIEDYRQEHLTFHNNRVILMMAAARTIKGFAEGIEHRYVGPIPEPFFSLVARLVEQARLENQICRWWRRMSHEELAAQMSYWESQ